MAKFIVTGCGASGTDWFTDVLLRLGVPCDHERAFRPDGEYNYDGGDVSWYAVPHVTRTFQDRHALDGPVVHLVRNPLDVVRSLGVFMSEDTSSTNFVFKHQPAVADAQDHLGRKIRYVAWWDAALIDFKIPQFKVEGVTPERLSAVVNYLNGPGGVTTENCEHVLNEVSEPSRGPSDITWSTIQSHPDGHQLVARAELLGYEVE